MISRVPAVLGRRDGPIRRAIHTAPGLGGGFYAITGRWTGGSARREGGVRVTSLRREGRAVDFGFRAGTGRNCGDSAKWAGWTYHGRGPGSGM